ncbi:MAG: FkbM family methyltransferase [Lysobacterales bacterium]|nr:MAG: FkbM family methyltransferase [Xanthomonadales bacterium]
MRSLLGDTILSVRNFVTQAARRALGAVGISALPLKGPRFGLDVFRDLKTFAPEHRFDVVLDVGANVGDFSVAAVAAFPSARIWAVEPIGSTFRQLEKRVGRWQQINPVHCAMGAADGELTIRLQDVSQHNSLLLEAERQPASGGPAPAKFETVRITSLDAFGRAHGVETVDLLKLDVEGYEREVIAGAGETLDRTAFVLCEAGLFASKHIHVPFETVAKLLWGKGFTLVAAYNMFYYFDNLPDGYGDVLFVNRSVCQLQRK